MRRCITLLLVATLAAATHTPNYDNRNPFLNLSPAEAKKRYDLAMSKMQETADALEAKEAEYTNRAKIAAAQERAAEKKEHREMQMVDALMPAASAAMLQTHGDARPDKLREAMKHNEVQEILHEVEQEHETGKPLTEDYGPDLRAWTALKDGWTPFPHELDPDEADVRADAHVIQLNLEAETGRKLTPTQQAQLIEATRVHEANQIKLAVAEKRNKVMRQTVDADAKRARKGLMVAQAEQLYAEEEKMESQVQDAQQAADMIIREGADPS